MIFYEMFLNSISKETKSFLKSDKRTYCLYGIADTTDTNKILTATLQKKAEGNKT